MIRHTSVAHEFVELIPAEREEGKIYISIPFSTAVHNCLCGCGMKVVTPIKPHKWVLTYDGETISLNPSVGNWSFACESHYFIRNSRVIDAGPLTREGVARVRATDEAARRNYYGQQPDQAEPLAKPPQIEKKPSFWKRMFSWKRK